MPKMTLNDASRSAFLMFVRSLFPLANIFGIVNLSAEQVGAGVVSIELGVTWLASTFKQGQEGPVGSSATASLQWTREQLEILPDTVLALLKPIGFDGSRKDLLDLLTAPAR